MTDAEVSRLQQNQHKQNMDRFEQLEHGHKELMSIQALQSAALARIEENTSRWPGIEQRLDYLERDNDRVKGGLGLMGIIFAGWEVFTHFFKK